MDFAGAAAEAAALGWTTVRAELGAFRSAAQRHGLCEVPVRGGEQTVDVLRPVGPDRARRRSMSAVHGTGAQPLHTDGAHHDDPPALVVLCAAASSRTPTLLWRPPPDSERWRRALSVGVFKVDSGRRQFLATASGPSGIRYDPTCMTPCDARARSLAAALADATHDAIPHSWADPNELLVIDNRVALHARASVADGDTGRTLRRVAFQGRIRP